MITRRNVLTGTAAVAAASVVGLPAVAGSEASVIESAATNVIPDAALDGRYAVLEFGGNGAKRYLVGHSGGGDGVILAEADVDDSGHYVFKMEHPPFLVPSCALNGRG